MKKKILSLQMLRAFAFLGIFISHTGALSLPLGTWGVSVFLVLSGFLMAVAYHDKKLETGLVPSLLFGWKKVLPLYPLHLITMLLTLPILKSGISAILKYIAANVTLVQSWFPDSAVYYSINSVAWYLSVSLFIYFIFPTVLKKLQGATHTWQLLIGAVAVVAFQSALAYLAFRFRKIEVGDNFFKWICYIFPLSRAGDFLIGSIFGCIFLRANADKTTHPIVATVLELAGLVLTVGAILCPASKLKMSWSGYSLWYLPGSLLLIYAFAINKGILAKILTNKVTVWVGDLSAYGFLLHQLIIRYLARIVPKITDIKLTKPAYAVLAFLFTVVFSALYKKYFAPLLARPTNAVFSKISAKLLRKNADN